MQFHPKNGRITARLLKDEETTEYGILLTRGQKERPVEFVRVVHVDNAPRGEVAIASGVPACPYHTGDVLLIDPMLCHLVGWLTDEFLIVPEHQVLAVVELEEGDALMGEEYDKENPLESRIVMPGTGKVS